VRRPLFRVLLGACLAALLGAVTLSGQASSDDCLVCHSDPVERSFTNGTTRTLQVHAGALDQSVHAGLACVDCHAGAAEVPHPERQIGSSRQFTVAMSETCRQCHFSEYTDTLESAHAQAVARGDVKAPVCVDCHGGHDIKRASEPRTRVADMCGSCHSRAAETFRKSVHGQDVAKNIADVPTCTDCHGTHRIAGSSHPGWRSSTPQICGSCHGNKERMAKYGLSTNVLRTYLADFHGKTASLRAAAGPRQEQTVVAVCSDCHGTHGVQRVHAPSSPVLKANIVNTCRTCHANASPQFPDAWLSHYDPSWKQTPAVMAVKTGYAVLIPVMIGGMLLQILTHLWRMAMNR